MYAQFQAKGAEVAGVSFDGVAANAAFAVKQKLPFPLLCDTAREMGMAYGAATAPTDGFAGRVSFVIGPDGRIKNAYPKVSPRTHPQEVLAAI